MKNLFHLKTMIYSETNCVLLYFFTFFKNWGVYTTEIKHLPSLEELLGELRTGRELHQKNTIVAKAILTNKYKDIMFDHPGCDKNNFYVSEEDIVYLAQKIEGGPFLLFVIMTMLKMRV